MLAPEIMNDFGQTWEEVREEVDRKLYGITDDPSVPYPWNEVPRQGLVLAKSGEKESLPRIHEIVLIAA